MKKIIAVALLLSTGAWGSDPYGITVTTNSTIIVPSTERRNATEWSAGASCSQGDVVSNAGLTYFVLSATGTTGTNAPTVLAGTFTDSQTNVYQYVSQSHRNFLVISMTEDKVAWLSFGETAVAGEGYMLRSIGSSFVFDNKDGYQGSVSAITTNAAGATLGVQEF
jgi:hypothetical protein